MTFIRIERVPRYTFDAVIAGRRRRFSTKRAAYFALASALLTARYAYVEDESQYELRGGEVHEHEFRVRHWTERGEELFTDEDAPTYSKRGEKFFDHVRRVARKLRALDEHAARKARP